MYESSISPMGTGGPQGRNRERMYKKLKTSARRGTITLARELRAADGTRKVLSLVSASGNTFRVWQGTGNRPEIYGRQFAPLCAILPGSVQGPLELGSR